MAGVGVGGFATSRSWLVPSYKCWQYLSVIQGIHRESWSFTNLFRTRDMIVLESAHNIYKEPSVHASGAQ